MLDDEHRFRAADRAMSATCSGVLIRGCARGRHRQASPRTMVSAISLRFVQRLEVQAHVAAEIADELPTDTSRPATPSMALLSSSSSVSEHRKCAVRSVVRWSADATSALLRFALRSASASLAALCVPSLDKSFGT